MKQFRGSYRDYSENPIGQTERFQYKSQKFVSKIQADPKKHIIYIEEHPEIGSKEHLLEVERFSRY